jgi:hypothetical protein
MYFNKNNVGNFAMNSSPEYRLDFARTLGRSCTINYS